MRLWCHAPTGHVLNSGACASNPDFCAAGTPGVDVMMDGHDHRYERFQPLDASGNPDSTYGIRHFIIGTGGQGLMTPGAQLPTSAVLSNAAHGVLPMTLAQRQLHLAVPSPAPKVPTPIPAPVRCHGAFGSHAFHARLKFP